MPMCAFFFNGYGALENCPVMGVSTNPVNLGKLSDCKVSPLNDVDDLVQPTGRSEESANEKKSGPI